MYLHIVEDEKFINQVIEQFESISPGQNTFLLVVPNGESKRKYVSDYDCIKEVVLNSVEYQDEIRQLASYTAIFLHNLYEDYKQKIVLNADEKIKFYLLLWGAEAYDRLIVWHKKLWMPLTRKTVLVNSGFLRNPLQKAAFHIKFQIKSVAKVLKFQFAQERSLRRIDYLGIFAKEDFENIRRHFPIKAEWFWFCYYTLEHLQLLDTQEVTNQGNNVLIGNSARFTNNHLDLFEFIRPHVQNSADPFKIICPLSYGNSNYAKHILKVGKESFGEKFIPLVEFISLEDYNKYISSCSVALMGQYRQQAVGNIISLIWFGTKVYLSDLNPLLHFFRNIGVKVFSIEEMNYSKFSNERLNKNEIDQNRSILKDYFSRDHVYGKLNHFLNEVIDSNGKH